MIEHWTNEKRLQAEWDQLKAAAARDRAAEGRR